MQERGKGMTSHHRHDLSDQAWASLAPHLPGKKGFVGRAQLQTIACSLTLSSGSFAQELHGETSLLTIDTGRILIGGFVDGEIKAYGKLCSKSESIPPDFEWILN